MITGCGLLKGSRSIEYLLDKYAEAYKNADDKIVKDIFSKFYVDYSAKYVTKERLEEDLKDAKERYGENFDITYKVTKKIKLTKKELDDFNKKMANYYGAKDKASECYKFEGELVFKGSKKTDTNSISTVGRCNYKGVWYLVKL